MLRLTICICSLLPLVAFCQPTLLEQSYPGVIESMEGQAYLQVGRSEYIDTILIEAGNEPHFRTSGYRGVAMTLWTDMDTLHFEHVNFPYGQAVIFPLRSPRDSTIVKLEFQASGSHFSTDYMASRRGTYDFDIPEVYELANVILYLSDCSARTPNRPDPDAYIQRVEEYFSPFRDHTLIQLLNDLCGQENAFPTYMAFRENSICYNFDQTGRLQYDTPYKSVRYHEGIAGGFFRQLLYLVQDFADQSDFRSFFAGNRAHYQSLLDRQKELLNIRQMWDWLEEAFPNQQDIYRILSSPLIGGSHSTAHFRDGYPLEPSFTECIMFINTTRNIDTPGKFPEDLKEPLYAGIIFTEIDHNYVNPASRNHREAIANLMGNVDTWTTKAAQFNYRSASSVFNEYMTHGLFCLYLSDVFPKEIADRAIEKRIQLMERRGFIKFPMFVESLREHMQESAGTVYEEYGSIIDRIRSMIKVD